MRRFLLALVVVLGSVPPNAAAQGDPVGPEFRVNTYTTSGQNRPFVAADSSGNFIVGWRSQDQDGSSFGMFGQRYSNSGTPMGPEFRVNTYTTGLQAEGSVAADSLGNFVVVWNSYDQDGSLGGIFGQRFAGAGAPLSTEFRVNTYTTGGQGNPAVAVHGSGDFVVVWNSYFGGGGGDPDGSIVGQRFASSGSPLGPEFRVNSYTTGYQIFPHVAGDAAGNFVVVWRSEAQDGSSYGVYAQRYASSGTPLGPEFRVNTYTTNHQGFLPLVAADSSGNFIVVWTSEAQDGSVGGVFGQRYASSGAPLGPEFRVNTYTTAGQIVTSIDADASGNFVIVWAGDLQDGSNYGVFAQRYAASGAPLGPEFRVNTYTTDDQFVPFVAADPSGNFVIVWAGDLQDGSNYGVLGQRYAPIVPVELTQFGVE
jgi:hypothetical protein